MPTDRKLSVTEEHVFGADAAIHPITNMPLEQGSGALPIDQQALQVHVGEIRRREGNAAADEVMRKLQMHIARKK